MGLHRYIRGDAGIALKLWKHVQGSLPGLKQAGPSRVATYLEFSSTSASDDIGQISFQTAFVAVEFGQGIGLRFKPGDAAQAFRQHVFVGRVTINRIGANVDHMRGTLRGKKGYKEVRHCRIFSPMMCARPWNSTSTLPSPACCSRKATRSWWFEASRTAART